MKKNRKKAEGYRFNGHPGFRPASIHPVRIADLASAIDGLAAKLADPADPDDDRWTARWLERYKKELDKKCRGQALKEAERSFRS